MNSLPGRPQARDSIEIEASPEVIWPNIGDSTLLPRWGPPVRAVELTLAGTCVPKAWVEEGRERPAPQTGIVLRALSCVRTKKAVAREERYGRRLHKRLVTSDCAQGFALDAGEQQEPLSGTQA